MSTRAERYRMERNAYAKRVDELQAQVEDLTRKLAAAHAVLADRDRALAELRFAERTK